MSRSAGYRPPSPDGISRFPHQDGPVSTRAQDGHLESVIPRLFLCGIDILAMCVAFGCTLILAPIIQGLVAPGGVFHVAWLSWLSLPGGSMDHLPPLASAISVVATTVPVTIATIELFGGYQELGSLSRARLLAPALLGPLFGVSVFTLAVFGLRTDHEWSRVFLFSYLLLSVVFLASYRVALRQYKQRRLATGRYARATAFVGRPESVERVMTQMRAADTGTLYRPVGFFRLDDGLGSTDAGVRDLGPVASVASVLVSTPIDVIVVVLPEGKAPWLDGVVRACDYLRVTVQIVPERLMDITAGLRDLHVRPVGPALTPGIVLQPWDVDRGDLFVKRVFDVVVASALLILLAPLFLLIAVAIKVGAPRSRVFYRWQVIGYKGRPFTGYKFTTMQDDADARRAELMHLNEMSGPVFKIKEDPRITRLGRLLRKFSLNELPQLWSVLTGDMSLVGPRPAGAWEIGQYADWHKRKLSFRPGITCLWQVRGRNKISQFDDWVRMDLEYIDNWSLWLDLKILYRTAWAVVGGSGS